MRKTLPKLLIAALLIVVLIVLIGGGDEQGQQTPTTGSTTTPTTTTTSPNGGDPDRETIDPLPKLRKGWREVINADAGFAFGLPPDWSQRSAKGGQGSVLSSPDDLVVISITADRTSGALSLPLDDFAVRTAETLASQIAGPTRFEDLSVGAAAPFDHQYAAVAVRATGTPKNSGAPEKVLVAVVRREQLASYVVVVRENAEQSSEFTDRDTVKRILRSLRGRPAT